VKGSDNEEEEDANAAAALPHAAAPVGAPSVHHYPEGPNLSPNTLLLTTLDNMRDSSLMHAYLLVKIIPMPVKLLCDLC
jgi:hypothetical protein